MQDTQLAVIAAIDDEIRIIKSRMAIDSQVHIRPAMITVGRYEDRPLVLVRSGIGFGAMKRAAEYLIDHYNPKLCVHVGYCGGCDPRYGAGDLIVADVIVNGRLNERHEMDGELADEAMRICRERGLRSKLGSIATVDRAIHSPHEKAFVGTEHGVIGIDMESAALVGICRLRGTKCLVVRAVVDALDVVLPKFGDAMDESGRIDGFSLAGNVIRRPKDILRISQVGYLAMQARQNITSFVDAWIKRGR